MAKANHSKARTKVSAKAGTTRRSTNSPRRVVALGFPGVQILDLVGPIEAFTAANQWIGEDDRYVVELCAETHDPIRVSSGLELIPERTLASVSASKQPIDTLLVPGGTGTRDAFESPRVIRWIDRTAGRSRRVASVCTGAFLLAKAGLLEGRRATTHWDSCELLARLFPSTDVDPDPIYVRDGAVYTSAGVTAGIDLALALIEEDHGRDVSLQVARNLVMFLKRPGGQSQFSAQLATQFAEADALRDLQQFIQENPGTDLRVEALARRVAMSPRHFARVFRTEIGQTPARYVEAVRVESARRHLEESGEPLESVARVCGFGSNLTMKRAFLRQIHVGPAEYRERFRRRAAR